MNIISNETLLPQLMALLRPCMARAMHDYEKQSFSVYEKANNDIVTSTDLAINEILIQGLKQISPNVDIVSEETLHDTKNNQKNSRYVWIIDPIDGTQQFSQGKRLFSISLALIDLEIGKSIVGIIAIPWTKHVYYYDNRNHKKTQMHPNPCLCILNATTFNTHPLPISKRMCANTCKEANILVSSRELYNGNLPPFLQKVKNHQSGSVALKMLQLIFGEVDLVVSMTPKYTWDLAGGAALLSAQPDLEIHNIDTQQQISFHEATQKFPSFVAGPCHLIMDFHKSMQLC